MQVIHCFLIDKQTIFESTHQCLLKQHSSSSQLCWALTLSLLSTDIPSLIHFQVSEEILKKKRAASQNYQYIDKISIF